MFVMFKPTSWTNMYEIDTCETVTHITRCFLSQRLMEFDSSILSFRCGGRGGGPGGKFACEYKHKEL